MRLLLVLLAACWSTASTPPAPAPAYPANCDAFDGGNPACRDVCHVDAPSDWAGCKTLAATLQAHGYVCTNLHPRSCRLARRACPQGGCVSLEARVIGSKVVGNHLELTLGVGEQQGVTTQWRAQLLHAKGGQPITGGQLVLVRVSATYSVATTSLTFDQIRSTLHVRLDP